MLRQCVHRHTNVDIFLLSSFRDNDRKRLSKNIYKDCILLLTKIGSAQYVRMISTLATK